MSVSLAFKKASQMQSTVQAYGIKVCQWVYLQGAHVAEDVAAQKDELLCASLTEQVSLQEGDTPLDVAAGNGQASVVELLLDSGVDGNAYNKVGLSKYDRLRLPIAGDPGCCL